MDYNPAGLSITLTLGTTGNQTLNLLNSGPASSQFTITEQAGSFTPMAPLAGAPALILNESFDGSTFPPVGWTRYDKDSSYVRSVGSRPRLPRIVVPARRSNNYGFGDPAEDGWLVTPAIGLGLNSTLTFWEKANYPADYVKHSVWVCISSCSNPPANYIQVAEAGELPSSLTWRMQTIDLNAYNNQTLMIAFRYEGYNADSWYIDDVQVTSNNDIVEWLSEAPTTGTIPADTGNVPVTVGFNAGDVSITQPGTYTAFLKVANQDIGNTPLTVPVTMTVQPAAAQGKLNGNVFGLLYCDGAPGAPLNNASVQIRGGVGISMTLKTDTAGYYQQWLDTGAYTVTVSAANYLGQAVINLSVPSAVTTTQNFNLRWLKACVNAAPTSLSATVNLGANATLPFTLTNLGAVSTPFMITEIEGGFNPYAPQAGGDVLVVNDGSTTAAAAMEAALTTLGFSYDEVTNTAYTGMTVSALLAYKAVLYAGTISSGAEQTQTIAYLDASGKLLVSDNDQGYSTNGSVFYATYLGATYGTDSGSKGPITGQDIMAGINTDISSDPYPDNFTITGANAVGIFANTSPRTGWAGLRIARNTYRAIYLAWDFQYTGGTADTATKLAVVDSAMAWLNPVDVPWLSNSPTTGTLAADSGLQVVNVTMDAAQVNQPGVYYAGLKAKTDDPVNPFRTIAVTMTVPLNPGMGKLNGIVYTQGACDINPAPLADASVNLTDGVFNWTVSTDASGYYQFWVETTAPLTVTASAADHLSDQAVVSVPASITVTHDLQLRWLKPCLDATPDSLSANLTYGLTTTKVLSLTNSGLAIGNFKITPYTQGFIPMMPVPGSLVRSAAPSAENAKTAPLQAGMTAPIFVPTGTDLITEGFEGATFPPTGWTQVVNDAAYTWQVATSSPHSGVKYADILYDPTPAQQDEWLLSPELNLTSATLSLWSFGSLTWCKVTYDNCDLNVWLVVGNVGGGDDILVGTADDAWTASWTWAQSTWNLDSLLPGGPVRIRHPILWYGWRRSGRG